jgi:predicted AlkP superfamily pyrophosphatase or phosphodiesterase
MEQASTIEKEIRSRCLRDGLFWPDYDGYCLSNLPATIFRLLDSNLDDRPTLPEPVWRPFAGIERVVLLVLDALGYADFLRITAKLPASSIRPGAPGSHFLPLTSVFPSTTATALSTLQSGLEPAEHGILGYRMYIPELDVVANMIKFTTATGEGPDLLERGLDPQRFFGAESVYERLERSGVAAASFVNKRFQESGLTRMLHRGRQIAHLAAADLVVRVRHWLEETAGQRAYVYAYWDLVDAFGHEYGPGTEEYDAEIASFLLLLERELLQKLTPEASRNALLVFTSDHGQIRVDLEQSVPLKEHPEVLTRLRALPAGGSRAVYLYVKPGQEKFVRHYLLRHFGDQFTVVDKEQAIEMGLFGNRRVSARVLPRLGDLVVLGKPGYTLFYPFKEDQTQIDVKGVHGGLSEDEMLVPCFFLPLEETLRL